MNRPFSLLPHLGAGLWLALSAVVVPLAHAQESAPATTKSVPARAAGKSVDAQGLRQALEQRAQAQKVGDDDAAPAIDTNKSRDGTTVVGDRESPIGLYITPWRNAAPEAELDRPARFLEEQLVPIDADVFRRQLEYYNTITDHLSRKATVPAVPKPQ